MTKLYACIMNKGGTSKTTSIVSLSGVILQDKTMDLKQKKILIIDLDTQGNVATSFGQNPDDYEKTVYDVLIGDIKPEEAIVTVFENENGRIDVLPANDDLANVEMDVLTDLEKYDKPLELLKNTCGHLIDTYDFILFDTPPHMGLITLNVLNYNVSVPLEMLIPLQPENFGFRSLNKVLQLFEKTKKGFNPNLKIAGIFGALIDRKTNIHGEILGIARQMATANGHNFCKTSIPRSIEVAKSYGYESLPITLSERNSGNAKVRNAYECLWEEIKKGDINNG